MLVTRDKVAYMETITATRYQARLHDTNSNRVVLARAMNGRGVDHDRLYVPALACAARLLSTCVHDYGVEPLPDYIRRGWPRERIYRPDVDRLLVNVLAAETEAGTNVFVSVTEMTVSSAVLSRFFQRGSDKYFGIFDILYSSNSSKLCEPDDGTPLLGPQVYSTRSSAKTLFTTEELPIWFDVDNSPACAPAISDGPHTTTSWDSGVFDGTMEGDGSDIIYDQTWSTMQVATARLTRR